MFLRLNFPISFGKLDIIILPPDKIAEAFIGSERLSPSFIFISSGISSITSLIPSDLTGGASSRIGGGSFAASLSCTNPKCSRDSSLDTVFYISGLVIRIYF